MAKLLLLLALCILPALATARQLGPHYVVRGRVYCDTCRFGFETPYSTYLAGAKVKIVCVNKDSLQEQYSTEGVTDKTGTFNIPVHEDHEDDICDAILVKSPKARCAKADRGRDRARLVLTNSNGVATNIRHANNMGFMSDEPLPVCGTLRKLYRLDDSDASTFWRV